MEANLVGLSEVDQSSRPCESLMSSSILELPSVFIFIGAKQIKAELDCLCFQIDWFPSLTWNENEEFNFGAFKTSKTDGGDKHERDPLFPGIQRRSGLRRVVIEWVSCLGPPPKPQTYGRQSWPRDNAIEIDVSEFETSTLDPKRAPMRQSTADAFTGSIPAIPKMSSNSEQCNVNVAEIN